MALTLNNFTGFETQGAEETSAVGGNFTYQTTGQRSGGAAIRLEGAANFTIPWVSGGAANAGADYIVGVAVKFTDATAVGGAFLRVRDSAAGEILSLTLESTSGDLLVKDAANSTIRTITAPFSDDIWRFLEIYFQDTASGTIEVFIDGISQGEDTSQDLTDGTSLDADADIRIVAINTNYTWIDDIYILSGVTSAADRYSNWAVKAYQSTDVGDTDQGDALADGTWALVSETPGNAGTSNDASYVDTGNLTGSTITDGGDRAGPSGDGDITGTTIKGAKYIANLKRTSGGGRVHTILHGNNVDGVTATADLPLTTDYIAYEVLSEAAGIVPTASEFFQQGFSKSATAGQDIFCGDQWAMLGYVPAAVGANPKGPLGHPLHGPFGGPV